MVDIEERGFEVGPDAVRDEQALDDAQQRVLAPRCMHVPRQPVEVAEAGDELGQRNRIHGLGL